MDNAVALAQAYLRLNGYFTVAEYPVIEATRGGYRTATDLDLLAFRFPHASTMRPAIGRALGADPADVAPDPALGAPPERADMIVAEVKEARAVLNAAATKPAVLRAAVVRFGCCPAADAPGLVDALLRDGHAILPIGHQIRLVAFGAAIDESNGGRHHRYHTISLGHALRFLQDYLREHWDVLRHADHKDPVFGFLVMLEKALQGAGRAGDGGARDHARAH